MLANRTADQASKFAIPAVDDAGNTIEGISASWQLCDARGVPIDAGVAADYAPGDDMIHFEIDKESLTLAAGVTSEGREIIVSITVENDGEIEVRDYFLVVASQPLALMVNSFITYPEALATRQSFGPVLDGWDATLDRAQRSSALADAYERLLRMSYKVPMLDAQSRAQSYAAYGTGSDEPFDFARRPRLRGMQLEEFDAMPAAFVKALKRAQLVEANIILGADVVGKKRQDGIISETIGESAVAFNPKPYLNLPISRQAYEELKRYIVFNIGVRRG